MAIRDRLLIVIHRSRGLFAGSALPSSSQDLQVVYEIDVSSPSSSPSNIDQAEILRSLANLNTFNKINQTCLTCTTVLSIPSPPVAFHNDPTESEVTQDRGSLDGAARAARREKIAWRSKPAFHEYERRDEGTKGHVLWRGEEKLGRWGVYKHVEEGIVQQNDGEDMKQTTPNA